MSSNVTFNGATYSIPADGDNSWGPDLTAYFISIASNAFQKTGGTFTLTAEAAFGATYGLKSPYFKSYAANPAAAGAVRLGNTESISWRNNANGADLALTSNASDALLFNSKNVLFSALGLIVNADINAAAAIAFSKMAALTASRLLVSDGSGVVSVSAVTATEAGYLSGVTSALQTQLNLLAPKASPTFSGTITTPLTASRLLVLGSSSELAVSAATAAEAAYLSGVTSAIQTQIDAKAPSASPTFTGTVTVPATITGAAAQVLTFPTTTGNLALNPMTTAGDIVIGGASGAPTRLAGAVGVLQGAVGSGPAYTQAPTLTTPSMTIPVISTRIDLTGGQIKFPAAVSASADANTLDDYEEGTWTPTLTTVAGTITSYTSSGRYQKIGNRIYFVATGTLTNAGTGSGLRMTLPFAAAAAIGSYSAAGRETVGAGKAIQGEIAPSGTYVSVFVYDNSNACITNYNNVIIGFYEV